MVEVIGWVGVAAAVVTFALGIVEFVRSQQRKKAVEAATKAAGDKALEVTTADPGDLQRHAGINFAAQWEGLAKLATALKDLDSTNRFLVVSLAFLAVAGATVGLDAVGDGTGGSGP